MMAGVEIELLPAPPPQEFTAETDLVAAVGSLTILDQGSYNAMAGYARLAVTRIATIEAYHKPRKQRAKAVHQEWCDQEKALLQPWQFIRDRAGKSITTWDQAQERARRENEARLVELARREEEEARLVAAVYAETVGASQEEVAAILEEPMVAAPVVAARTYQPAAGISTRETWRAEVTDLKALCLAVGQGRVPVQAVEAAMPVLNAQARSLKTAWNWPGCRAVKENGVAVRR